MSRLYNYDYCLSSRPTSGYEAIFEYAKLQAN